MKVFIHSIVRIMAALFIFAFAVSCSEKKGPADEERNQDNEAAVAEQALAVARERAILASDWKFNPGFVGNHQLDEETTRLIEGYIENYPILFGRDFFYKDNLVLDGIQYVKVPIDEGWGSVEPIVFIASYMVSPGLNKRAVIYLLIFFKENGLIYDHWTRLGITIDQINITNGRELNYDYIEDLPGRRIGNSSALVGDFNQDGYDEIVMFDLDYLPENYFSSIILFSILSVTYEHKEPIYFEPIFEARIQPGMLWDIRTWEYGPPIQFGTYKGTEGFVIYEHTPTGATTFQNDTITGDLDEVPEYKDQWNFYAWDADEEQYVFIDQMVPNEIRTQWQEKGD
ncbi:MAG: hypothetical protein LBI14_07460 [Treponema sp.]|nr:hypothetical protein [Treponema sp.]